MQTAMADWCAGVPQTHEFDVLAVDEILSVQSREKAGRHVAGEQVQIVDAHLITRHETATD